MEFLAYLIVPLLLGLWAQWKVKSTFARWSEVGSVSGVSGAEAAERLLRAAGVTGVTIERTEGVLTDHYDPSSKTLRLSADNYDGHSVAALGIAAHEAGHAIQHARAYAPLKWRMAIVPATQFASQILPLVIIGGFMFHITGLITLGIICYAVLAVFQLITLPVEFDASNRAKVILQQMGMVQPGGEAAGVNSVLNAAALTYVAAFVAALGNLVYLIMARRHE